MHQAEGERSIRNQVCLGLPVLRRQSLEGPRMQAWSLKSSRMVLTGVSTTKVAKERQDRSGWLEPDQTTSLETKSIQISLIRSS